MGAVQSMKILRGGEAAEGPGASMDASTRKAQTPPFLAKLAKVLAERSLRDSPDKEQGVFRKTFVETMFPDTQSLGEKMFYVLQKLTKCALPTIPEPAFVSAVDSLLQPCSNSQLIYFYLLLFVSNNDRGIIKPEDFKQLMYLGYELAVGTGKSLDEEEEKFVNAYADSVYQQKSELTLGVLERWILQNSPRIFQPLTRHLVDRVCYVYATISASQHTQTEPKQRSIIARCLGRFKLRVLGRRRGDKGKAGPGGEQKSTMLDNPDGTVGLLAPMSPEIKKAISAAEVWIFSSALPDSYLRSAHTVVRHRHQTQKSTYNFFAELLSGMLIPKHWQLLYDSRDHGAAMNRFLFHVMRYRGHTVLILYTDTHEKVCIAVDEEWRDGPVFWGRDDAIVLSLQPNFTTLCSGKKIVCFNTKTRGIPLGVTVGPDPRKPIMRIDKTWTTFEKNNVPSGKIVRVLVFGAADPGVLETQRKLQEAQEKYAENRRKVQRQAVLSGEYDIERAIIEMVSDDRKNYGQYQEGSRESGPRSSVTRRSSMAPRQSLRRQSMRRASDDVVTTGSSGTGASPSSQRRRRSSAHPGDTLSRRTSA